MALTEQCYIVSEIIAPGGNWACSLNSVFMLYTSQGARCLWGGGHPLTSFILADLLCLAVGLHVPGGLMFTVN